MSGAFTTPSTANNTVKAKVKTTAKDKVATPEGLTPSQRDGAPGRAILCYSPWECTRRPAAHRPVAVDRVDVGFG